MEENKRNGKVFVNKNKYEFKKRAVPRTNRKETDIYISQKSNNKSYIERIEKLWNNGEDEVSLHALGGAIEQAIIIALQLKENHCDTYDLDVSTNSIGVVGTSDIMFKISELIQWLGVTSFEMLIYLIGLVVFTILLTFHINYSSNYLSPSEIKLILMPLFTADLWNAYFCLIVFIRTYMDKNVKGAIFGALWSFFLIGDLVLFKFLLYQKLIGVTTLEYSEVVSPIILLLQLIAIRACQTR